MCSCAATRGRRLNRPCLCRRSWFWAVPVAGGRRARAAWRCACVDWVITWFLSAIGIAGMDRVMQHNVLAMSGKAAEASGDVNTLLLDKTGTITLGNRQAVESRPDQSETYRSGERLRRGFPQGEPRF